MSKAKQLSRTLVVFISIICFVVGACGGFVVFAYVTNPKPEVYVSGDLSFHFMELNNEHTGDSTLVKVGNTEVLIDAGSKTDSIPTICNYINEYVSDGKIEYVIVTHAHEDHYAGFATPSSQESIFDKYEIGVIIDFAQITSGKANQNMYKNYQREVSEAVSRGAKHYTALECAKEQNGASKTYNLNSSVTMNILYHKFYESVSSTENNHSVCTLFTQGDKNFLFTGDLEKEGEESLVENNNLPHCVLYKAGHHGSKTSSNDVLLSAITPEICCVCCCAGNAEYTQTKNNMFPTQDFIDRISKYTDKVYVTTLGKIEEVDGKFVNCGFESFNGNIAVTSTRSGVTVKCSNNDIILKDSDWFRDNRTVPEGWA